MAYASPAGGDVLSKTSDPRPPRGQDAITIKNRTRRLNWLNQVRSEFITTEKGGLDDMK